MSGQFVLSDSNVKLSVFVIHNPLSCACFVFEISSSFLFSLLFPVLYSCFFLFSPTLVTVFFLCFFFSFTFFIYNPFASLFLLVMLLLFTFLLFCQFLVFLNTTMTRVTTTTTTISKGVVTLQCLADDTPCHQTPSRWSLYLSSLPSLSGLHRQSHAHSLCFSTVQLSFMWFYFWT